MAHILGVKKQNYECKTYFLPVLLIKINSTKNSTRNKPAQSKSKSQILFDESSSQHNLYIMTLPILHTSCFVCRAEVTDSWIAWVWYSILVIFAYAHSTGTEKGFEIPF
jgi:hypothetical protein